MQLPDETWLFTGSDYSPDLAVTDTFYVSCTDAEIQKAMSYGNWKYMKLPRLTAGHDQSICTDLFTGITLQGNFGWFSRLWRLYQIFPTVDIPISRISPRHLTAKKVLIGLCPPPSNCSFSISPASCPTCGPGTIFLTSLHIFVTNDPPGPCVPAVDTVVVTIYPEQNTFAASATYCAGVPVSLKGFIFGSTSGTFSGGQGTFTGDAKCLPSGEEHLLVTLIRQQLMR